MLPKRSFFLGRPGFILLDYIPKMKACTAPEGSIRYVVVRFDDRNRYGTTGVPATLLFSGGDKCVVRMKEQTIEKAGKRNRYGKIVLEEKNPGEAQMIELLGPVGEARAPHTRLLLSPRLPARATSAASRKSRPRMSGEEVTHQAPKWARFHGTCTLPSILMRPTSSMSGYAQQPGCASGASAKRRVTR